jgi:hypothetical protein
MKKRRGKIAAALLGVVVATKIIGSGRAIPPIPNNAQMGAKIGSDDGCGTAYSLRASLPCPASRWVEIGKFFCGYAVGWTTTLESIIEFRSRADSGRESKCVITAA